jgi:hypothetical protein
MSDDGGESVQPCEAGSRSARNKARRMTCAELLAKIQELTDLEKSGRAGAKGLSQRLRDYLGEDATHGPAIVQQQAALRAYLAEYVAKGCGDPPPTSRELSERPLLTPPNPSDESARQMVESAALAGGGVALGYVVYRVIRFIPSLIPPLWPTLPANAAIP